MTGTTALALIVFIAILGGIAAASAGIFAQGDASAKQSSSPLSVLGLLAIGYPVYALVSAAGPGASFADALGAALSALGDVLGLSALVIGHFRVLGLNSRRFTGLVGFALWMAGFALGSAPFTAALAHREPAADSSTRP